MEKTIDGTYTRMLRAVLNVFWKPILPRHVCTAPYLLFLIQPEIGGLHLLATVGAAKMR